jgi:voltage-gated sodium channel
MAFEKFDDDETGTLDMFEFVCMMHAMNDQSMDNTLERQKSSRAGIGIGELEISSKITFIDAGITAAMHEFDHGARAGLEETLDMVVDAGQEAVEAMAHLGTDLTQTAEDLAANLVGGLTENLGDMGNMMGGMIGAGGAAGKVGDMMGGAAETMTDTLTDAADKTNSFLLEQYIAVGSALKAVTRSYAFNAASILVVLIAGGIVAVQVGYDIDEDAKKLCDTLDIIVLSLFATECVMKIFSNPLAPWIYFTDKTERAWNIFDFSIVIVSIPGVVGSQAAILRLFRLMRVIKIIDKLPKLKVILSGLFAGLNACGYIMMLMAIIFYIYACAAVNFFKANDPWHWYRLSTSFETLFRSATLEDWAYIYYTAFYGCQVYDNGIYVALPSWLLPTSDGDSYSDGVQPRGDMYRPSVDTSDDIDTRDDTRARVRKAPANQYCEANGLPSGADSLCDPASSRCVLHVEDVGAGVSSSWYGCECLGELVPDLTPEHLFASLEKFGHGMAEGGLETGMDGLGVSDFIAAITAAGEYSSVFPYAQSNNFSVAEMVSAANSSNVTLVGGLSSAHIHTNSSTGFYCAQPDKYGYPWMPALRETGGFDIRYCEDNPKPLLAVLFFGSFIAITSFIIMSLFVGSVLISIMESVESINHQVSKKKQAKHDDLVELEYMNVHSKNAIRKKQAVQRLIFEAWMHRSEKSEDGRRLKHFGDKHLSWVKEKAIKADAKKKRLSKQKSYRRVTLEQEQVIEHKRWMQVSKEHGMDEVAKHVPPFFVDPFADLETEHSKHFGRFKKMYFNLSLNCEKLANNSNFQWFITLCIVIASTLAGVEVTRIAENKRALLDGRAEVEAPLGLVVMDHLVSATFLIELLIKIVAKRWKPWVFFVDGDEASWNRFDFIVVLASFAGGGALALVLRMVRLFRVLKLLKKMPQLRMLVASLMGAVDSIIYTCILMLLFFFVSGIVSVMIFKQNDPWHFFNLHRAMMTLFRSATGDNWTDIMYTSQYGCDRYPPLEGTCDNPKAFGWWAVLWFSLFYMMGGLVFLNLFIGVVTAGTTSPSECAPHLHSVTIG